MVLRSDSDNSAVLIVPGYLELKSEILARETGPPPNIQMETKYIVIGKNTKIIDDQGNALKIDELAPEDYLVIIPYMAAEYSAPYMLADKITVTKKVWPEGENPFMP
jgi:hypothetical protein